MSSLDNLILLIGEIWQAELFGHYLLKFWFLLWRLFWPWSILLSGLESFSTSPLAASFFSTVSGILFPKFFWPTVRKKCSSDREKLLKFEAEGRGKIFEITRTIYSNSERSEQFLVTECFSNLFLEVPHI